MFLKSPVSYEHHSPSDSSCRGPSKSSFCTNFTFLDKSEHSSCCKHPTERKRGSAGKLGTTDLSHYNRTHQSSETRTFSSKNIKKDNRDLSEIKTELFQLHFLLILRLFCNYHARKYIHHYD